MTSLAQTVATLEARRAALARELATVETRLNVISKAVEGPSKGRAVAPSESPAAAPAAPAVATKAKKTKPKAKRVWFEKNELPKLLRKAARNPMTTADLVRELAQLKGYVGRLSDDDLRRFQGAAFMAVAQAVKNKLLKRRASGEVVLA